MMFKEYCKELMNNENERYNERVEENGGEFNRISTNYRVIKLMSHSIKICGKCDIN